MPMKRVARTVNSQSAVRVRSNETEISDRTRPSICRMQSMCGDGDKSRAGKPGKCPDASAPAEQLPARSSAAHCSRSKWPGLATPARALRQAAPKREQFHEEWYREPHLPCLVPRDVAKAKSACGDNRTSRTAPSTGRTRTTNHATRDVSASGASPVSQRPRASCFQSVFKFECHCLRPTRDCDRTATHCLRHHRRQVLTASNAELKPC
jgi:hypothetical protein